MALWTFDFDLLSALFAVNIKESRFVTLRALNLKSLGAGRTFGITLLDLRSAIRASYVHWGLFPAEWTSYVLWQDKL
jgi:hypothetical protein